MGKGDRYRYVDQERYEEHYEHIFGMTEKATTGSYVYDEEKKQFVKISDRPQRSVYHGLNGKIWNEENEKGIIDRALRRPFKSVREKAEFMRANNLVMEGSSEPEKSRTKRLCNIINESREKQGLSPKTEKELVGNSKEAK